MSEQKQQQGRGKGKVRPGEKWDPQKGAKGLLVSTRRKRRSNRESLHFDINGKMLKLRLDDKLTHTAMKLAYNYLIMPKNGDYSRHVLQRPKKGIVCNSYDILVENIIALIDGDKEEFDFFKNATEDHLVQEVYLALINKYFGNSVAEPRLKMCD